jgi:hypothetical protein
VPYDIEGLISTASRETDIPGEEEAATADDDDGAGDLEDRVRLMY